MSKKLFTLISIIVAALQSVGVGLVDYFEVAHATAIDESIVIIGTAIVSVCGLFTVNEEVSKAKNDVKRKR